MSRVGIGENYGRERWKGKRGERRFKDERQRRGCDILLHLSGLRAKVPHPENKYHTVVVVVVGVGVGAALVGAVVVVVAGPEVGAVVVVVVGATVGPAVLGATVVSFAAIAAIE